jgi:Fur family transcriptional regulator, ferric uptake regulator
MPTHGAAAFAEATERFRAYLRSHRLRLTRERLDVIQTALEAEKHFDAEDLLAKLGRRRPRVSRATAYRTLSLLEECGILRRSLLGQGRSLYERAIGRGHHDHIVCASCGRIVEFFDSELEALQEKIATRRGFRIHRHIHELFGTCRVCRNGQAGAIRGNGKRRIRRLA